MIRISELRKIRHLSQKEFGTLFQVSQNTVSQWERGHRGMDPEMIIKIAEHFGITTDYLLGREITVPGTVIYAEESDSYMLLDVRDLTGESRDTIRMIVELIRSLTSHSA